MIRRLQTIQPEYFDALYKGDSDPWKFASSDYEREKYARTLHALPKDRYPRALEIGCSIGVLTRQLAQRCSQLIAVDAAAEALAQARERCRDCDNVEFAEMFVPDDWPTGEFDLIVLSEVIYYLEARDVARLAARVEAAAVVGSDIVLVHWTGETDYPLTGEAAAERFIADARHFAAVIESYRHAEYRLDVLARR